MTPALAVVVKMEPAILRQSAQPNPELVREAAPLDMGSAVFVSKTKSRSLLFEQIYFFSSDP